MRVLLRPAFAASYRMKITATSQMACGKMKKWIMPTVIIWVIVVARGVLIHVLDAVKANRKNLVSVFLAISTLFKFKTYLYENFHTNFI